MRFCIKCGKPMFTSLESVWIKNKNYSIHKKCKEENKMTEYNGQLPLKFELDWADLNVLKRELPTLEKERKISLVFVIEKIIEKGV